MKKIINSPSQANQDSFVMNMLGWKRNGFYLEVGASHPYTLSNTYSLENYYDWSGVSLEIDTALCDKFNAERKNKCFNLDAMTTDYAALLESVNAPKTIDYLQVDIDPAPNTLAALISVPFDKYEFSVITFEHDVYSKSEYLEVQKTSQKFLSSFGYKMIIENIWNEGNPFEDWYVNPKFVKEEIWGPIISSNVDHKNLFKDDLSG